MQSRFARNVSRVERLNDSFLQSLPDWIEKSLCGFA